MLIESRRRAYLNAMQVVNWLPRTELPFAAPSRPELLEALEPYEAFETSGEEAAACTDRCSGICGKCCLSR